MEIMKQAPASSMPRHLRVLGRVMDDSIRLPGGYRIGWDGLIGLIPGVGDAIGLLVSGYIIAAAARLRAPGTLLLRMAANVGLETLIGAIPIAGDLFDFVFKANVRNLALLDGHLDRPMAVRRSSALLLLALVIGLLLATVLALFLAVRFAKWLWTWVA